MIPILLSFLSPEYSPTIQTSTGDFLKAIITISANASQHEQSCIGPNDLTRELVSEPCIKSMIQDMLKGGNPLTVGVGIIIEVIRKNNSDYDPENLTGVEHPPSSRDPIYLGTLLRLFAANVPDFMELVMNQNEKTQNADGTCTEKKRELRAAYGGVIEPLGFNRFKTCELMAELLHCSNMALLNEKGSDRYVKERDKERERLKAVREKARESQKELSYSQDLGGFRFLGVMGEKGPLEVQNGDDNSSDGTTEDDGFEDVGAEGSLMDEIRPLKAATKVDTEDEDVELVLDVHATERFDPGGDTQEAPLFPPLQASESELDKQSLPIPTVEITPADDPIPSIPATQPIQVMESVVEGLENVELQDQGNAKELPTIVPQMGTETGDLAVVSEGALPDSSDNLHEKNVEEEESQKPSEVQSPEQVIAKPKTPPPPYSEDNSSSTHTQEFTEAPTADQPAPEVIAAAHISEPLEQQHTDLPPITSNTPEKPEIENTPETLQKIGIEQTSTVSPLGDPTDSEADQNAQSTSIPPDPPFREHASLIEPDYDGNPVVGDYLKMQFVEHRVVVTILDFFFRFPWNNFLHNVVYDVVQQVFNGPMDRGYNRSLAIDLFVTGRITERIIEGQRASDKAQRETKMRMGYMGHLTLIAEEVVKFTEKYFNPPDILSQVVLEKVMHPDWVDYVENVLSETRERDNAILGGFRPDQSLGPRSAAFGSMEGVQGLGGFGGLGGIGGSSGISGGLTAADLDTIDLANGTGGVGSGGSGSYTAGGSSATTSAAGAGLHSGFGSSSDEEEDDMDEDEEMGGVGGGSRMSMGIGSSSNDGVATNDQVGDLLFDDDIDPDIVDKDLLAKYRLSFEDIDRF